MKKTIIALLACLLCLSVSAQKLKGQWRGYFNSTGDIVTTGDDYNNVEYVLELEFADNVVTGFSYSYFQGRKYYVICALKGSYNKTDNTITVTETKKVKGNTPPPPFWQDCLQTHTLKYKKDGTTEVLTGSWTPASADGTCGKGSTTLTRKTLSNDLASFNKSQTRTPVAKPKKPAPKTPVNTDVAKVKTPPAVKKETLKPGVKAEDPAAETVVINDNNPDAVKKEIKVNESNDAAGFEKRDNNIIKTIVVESETFKVNLYDNGDIDGDTVSLFYNGKLVLAHKRLSDKPISLILDATTTVDMNELTMYAENLGAIPPNTALMVVNDGDKRYEVRIASDLQKSGTIRFVHKSKVPPPK